MLSLFAFLLLIDTQFTPPHICTPLHQSHSIYVKSHVPPSPWTPAGAGAADDDEEEEAAAADAVPGSVLTRLFSCLTPFFSSFTPPAAAAP